MLIHHTDCGVVTFTDDEFRAASRPRPASGRRAAVDGANTGQSVHPHKDSFRGFVYDVATGKLIEVAGPERRQVDSR